MKKATIKTVTISSAVTAAMFGINMLLGKLCGFIIGYEFWGGEVSETIGFGVSLRKFYPLTSADDVGSGRRASVGIDPLSLIVTFLLCAAVVGVVCFVRQKRCSKKAKADIK